MIVELKDISSESLIRVPVCIIGAGAVGLCMATKFANESDENVLVLESGSETPLPEPAPCRVENIGDIETFREGSYNQGLGGSSLSWGGQILPFCESDFIKRNNVQNSGWPISKQDLEPFYSEAEILLDVDYCSFNDDVHSIGSRRPSKKSGLKLHFSKWCPEKNLALHFAAPLLNSANVQILLNAQVDRLEQTTSTEFNKGCKHIHITVCGDKKVTVISDLVIVAAGGLDNYQLLAKSPTVCSKSQALGHYFHDHVGFYGAKLTPVDWRLFNALFSTKLRKRGRCVPKLQLTDTCLTELGIVNVNGSIEIQETAMSVVGCAKNIYRRIQGEKNQNSSLRRDLFGLFSSLPEAIVIAFDYVFHSQVSLPRSADYYLLANAESMPLLKNQLRINSTESSQSNDVTNVAWHMNDLTRDSMREYYLRAKEYLESNSIAHVEIKKSLFQDDQQWHEGAYSLYHHMGATRMGHDINTSVVDRNCEMHECSGVYIAGCSVLPTGSCSNPTFTAIALGLRLVEHVLSKK